MLEMRSVMMNVLICFSGSELARCLLLILPLRKLQLIGWLWLGISTNFHG